MLAVVAKRYAKVVAIGAALLTLAACNGSFIGSGTMPSASSSGTALMSLNVKCDTTTQQVSGTFMFKDVGSRVITSATLSDAYYPWWSFPASMEGTLLEEDIEIQKCESGSPFGAYTGRFTGAVNGMSDSGWMYVIIELDGCGSTPWIEVQFDGMRGDYYNSGCMSLSSIRSVSS